MADKYPEYREKVQIQPAAQSGGQHDAISGVKASYDMAANMASEYAVKLSREKAAASGAEMARKNPNMDYTAITPSDEAFVKSYNAQASMMLDTEATRALANVSAEFGKIANPTANDSLKLNQAMANAVKGIIGNAPKSIKSDLEYSFNKKLVSESLKMAERVNTANQKRIKENAIMSNISSSEEVNTEMSNKNTDGAIEIYEKQVERNNALKGELGELAVMKMNMEAKQNKNAAYLSERVKSAYQQDGVKGGQRVLKEILNEKTSEMSESDKFDVLSVVNARFANMVKTDGLADNLLLQEASLTLQQNGSLSPEEVSSLREDLSESGFNKLMLAVGKQEQKNKKTTEWVNYANKFKTDSTSLSKIPGKERNEIRNAAIKNFTEQNGREPTFEEDVTLISGSYKMEVPDLTNSFDSRLESDNAEIRCKAAELAIAAQKSNRALVSKVDQKNMLLAMDIDRFRKSQHTPEESSRLADKMRTDIDTQDNLKSFNEAISTDRADLKSVKRMNQHIEDRFGFSVEDSTDEEASFIPMRAVNDYRNALEFGWQQKRKLDFDYADQQMVRAGYKETWANGIKQFMKGAVDNYVPLKFAKEQFRKEAERLVGNLDKAIKNPNIPINFKYELTKQETGLEKIAKFGAKLATTMQMQGTNVELNYPEDSFLSPSIKKQKITANRIDKHGGKVPGYFVFEFDDRSEHTPPGQIPSYGVYFVEDDTGVRHQISDIKNVDGKIKMTDARFTISQKAIKDLYSEPAELKRLSEDYAIAKLKSLQQIKNIDPTDETSFALKALLKQYPGMITKKSKELKKAQKEIKTKEKELR